MKFIFNKMKTWIKTPYIITGIGVGVGVILVVKVLKRKNKDEIVRTESNRISRALKIPKGFVGHVLGKGGATIKSIREQSKARVNFDDSDNEFTIATITGSPESVEEAVDLINAIINNRHACVTKEIFLQGKITDSVWKNINYIRQICDSTRAKIVFDFHPCQRGKESPTKIIIKGRKEEVESAFDLIDELMADVEVTTNKQSHVAGRALPENMPLHTTALGIRTLPTEELVANSSDGYVEVYVSASLNPSKFWVQICGPKSTQLDKLAVNMTEFYNDDRNKERLQLSSFNSGDIVAAFFQGDNSWYRAQVMKTTHEDNKTLISVFYLDFGDGADLSPDLVCILDPNFLSVPFQAIECLLHGIIPVDGTWSAEAIDVFEKLTYVAQWKMLMAKPVSRFMIHGGDGKSAVMPWAIKILDTHSPVDVDIGNVLVEMGFAKVIVIDRHLDCPKKTED